MSNTKHTPGPWKVGHWMEDADGCNLLSRGQFEVFPIPQDSEAEANARLIATAPELLEAAIAALMALGSLGNNMSDGQHRREWEMLHRAIAKAEGKGRE